jgi:hypothetical protein
MSMPKKTDFRAHAVLLVFGSAFVLFFISAVFQVAAWELRHFYQSGKYGRLSGLPYIFFDMFGHRPDLYLMAVIFWLWWPMVAMLLYCVNSCSHNFARAFLYGFAYCWLLTAVVLSFMAFLCVYQMMVILLHDVDGTPQCMWLVSLVSWLLPVALLMFVIAYWLRFRNRHRRDP